MIKKTLWALSVFIFLVIISPVFMLSMFAPAAMGTILVYWCGFVAVTSLVGGAVFLYARAETRQP